VPTTQAAAPAVGVLKAPSGRFYEAGEYCPVKDKGLSTVDSAGKHLTCVYESGRYHWHD
jgi:hypothetical protein